jgi:lipopolysaccharide heptosyltransferase II
MELKKNNTSTAEKLVKNSIRLFTGETISKLIALATQIVAARYLGDKGFGTFAFAFSITGILAVLADTGINTLLIREISREPDKADNYLGNAFFLKAGLSVVILAMLLAMPNVFPLGEEARLVVWAIGLAMLINGYSDTYIAVFRAFENMALVSILMIIQRGMFFTGAMVLLLMDYKVVPLSLAFLAAAVLNLIIVRWKMKSIYGSQLWVVDKSRLKEILSRSLPIGGTIFFTYIYFRIDSVMLFFLRGEAETGWYSAALKLIEAAVILIAGIRNAIFPILSKTYADRSKSFVNIWREGSRFLLIVSLPVAAAISLLAPRLVKVLYGDAFEGTGHALQIVVLALPLLCLNDIVSYLLMSADKATKVLKITGIGACVSVVINAICIPIWGYVGAALATCATELLVFCIYFKTISNIWERKNLWPPIWRPIIAAGGMLIVLWGLFSLPLLPLLIIGFGVYFGLLMGLGAFTEYDWKVLREVLDLSKLPAERKNQPLPVFTESPQSGKILMIKLGAVGDLVMASSFFDQARKQFPNSDITLLTGKYSYESIRNNLSIDRFIRVDDKALYRGAPFARIKEVLRIILDLRKENFDLAFIMHRAWPFNLLIFICGIPCRVGFSRGREGFSLTHRAVPRTSRNERENYLDLLRVLGMEAQYEGSYYFVSEKENLQGQGFVEKLGLQEGEKLIAVAPGGGKNVKLEMPNKRWPKDYYIDLIKKLNSEIPCKIILFGSADERDLIKDIRNELPQCYGATNLSLGEVASIFKECSLFIGNDSGPLHIASAMSTPTLSFYGPTNPKDWAPPGETNITLYKNVECSPCYDNGKFPECHHLNCLYSISVEEAWEQVKISLGLSRAAKI